jgi:tRNA (cmo5U34)-methyltransferase
MVKFTFATEEDGFDSHIEKSIRGYENLWGDILKFSEYFVEDGTTVIDIGCSTGKMLKAMKIQNDRFAPKCVYKGIEFEEDFFCDLENDENLFFEQVDIRGFDWNAKAKNCTLVISMFTLQFIPKRDRQIILNRINGALTKGGALIFSEKILSETAQVEEMMTFCYYDWKRRNFSSEEILEKEERLRHMMKPLRLHEIVEMLQEAGFRDFQSFWQNFNFVGIIALKS